MFKIFYTAFNHRAQHSKETVLCPKAAQSTILSSFASVAVPAEDVANLPLKRICDTLGVNSNGRADCITWPALHLDQQQPAQARC